MVVGHGTAALCTLLSGGSARTGAPCCCTDSTPEHVRTVDTFYDGAAELRGVFDEHFASPRQAHPMRFVWDYWHVPEQYTLHRTQAATYFEPELFDALTKALTEYGQQHLGCRDISPPWLSYYIDGCEQRLHADVPQGPFAYVLSLTNWDERVFSGGETSILQPFVLDYWRGFDSTSGLEQSDLLVGVAPRFNRLTIFDARLPHGVTRVEGTRDPREARLVLHGWFTEPQPHFEGALDEKVVERGLGKALEEIYAEITPPLVTGVLSMRLTVGESGKVEEIKMLADTLVCDPSLLEEAAEATSAAEARSQVIRTVTKRLEKSTFEPSTQGVTMITIPFVFD